ncbi:spore germination protein [Pontibacillus sp. ALD_SL1]|uniref:spore germination protein n=1 Tax=Pontibacillus sp. ALD_SL1 TaxID=2777185 RepID=UPI001A9746F6|nr:spore germination protein [Pontibacillus sp. ALD_SL1]QST00606.1 spore germination protein [Pontibacillus sp. ALD_SL1]
MRRSVQKKKKASDTFPCTIEELKKKLSSMLQDSPDLNFSTYTLGQKRVIVFYFTYQINKEHLHRSILDTLLASQDKTWDAKMIQNEVPLASSTLHDTLISVAKELIQGGVGIYVDEDDQPLTYYIPEQARRAVSRAENESLVLGPQIAFTESMVTNLNIIRWRLDTPEFKTEKLIIGTEIPTEVRIVYLKNIANDDLINTVRQRLEDLDVNDVMDSNVLAQYIEDRSTSIFPQLLTTELPDRFCNSIINGKVGIMVDKSPTVLITPATLFSFLESTEDIYFRWNIGTFLRIMRLAAMFLSILLTPAYVAALSFHVEVIPSSLLVSLGQSRANVPFPPVFEALLLELLIELLREAGARLPTKVGQTMGIVGGIVLGQAAVKAGFTSNILIIIVALSALASFTAPSYMMGGAIRVIRFPMIILSGLWGLLGIFLGLSFLVIHLLKVSSIGTPYLSPLYPFHFADLDNSIVRLPWSRANKRPTVNETKKPVKFSQKEAKKKRDIDE